MRLIEQILNDERLLNGKALSDFKLLGLARDGGYSALALEAQGKLVEEVARIWTHWLKRAGSAELATASPSGRLAQAKVAFATFWAFPDVVRTFFLDRAQTPTPQDRPVLQAIELLANTGRRLPTLTVADVRALAPLLRRPGALPPATAATVRDYLENKGTRGWGEPDRRLILEAWRDA